MAWKLIEVNAALGELKGSFDFPESFRDLVDSNMKTQSAWMRYAWAGARIAFQAELRKALPSKAALDAKMIADLKSALEKAEAELRAKAELEAEVE